MKTSIIENIYYDLFYRLGKNITTILVILSNVFDQ